MLVRNWLVDFAQDLRYASRMFRANPMFTFVVILTLGLGIGANTALFSVLNAVALRALPVPEPQQLFHLRVDNRPENTSQTGEDNSSFTMNVFQELRTGNPVFSDLMAFVPLAISKTAVRAGGSGGQPEEVSADMASGNFFTGLGVRMHCGRPFGMEDETGRAQVAVLSHAYMNRRFGGNCSSAIGQILHVRGVPMTIIGVTAREFKGVESSPTDVWVPLQIRKELSAWGQPSDFENSNWWFLMMIGRLAPGVSEKQAEAQLAPIFQRAAFAPLGRQQKSSEKTPVLTFDAASGMPGLRSQYLEPLKVLLAMVGLVLLIACGNVAMLLAARNEARKREFSIRMAVGGGRARLFRQLLAESLLLVAGGAALAWILGLLGTEMLTAWSGLEADMSPDRNVLLFTLAVSLLVSLTFGLAPLRTSTRVPLGLTLKTSSAASGVDRERALSRKVAIAIQIALCVVVVAGSGLLVKTLSNLKNADLGMRASGLLVFGVSPLQTTRSDAATLQFYDRLLDRLRALPGVESTTLMQNRIGSGWSNNTSAIVDGKRPQAPQGSYSSMRWNAVGPNYFHTLGAAMLFGRDLSVSDTATGPKVAVVNEAFAKRYLPDQNPIGHSVAIEEGKEAPQYSIVGVAANSRYTGVRERVAPMAYFPHSQISGIGTMHVEVRTSGSPETQLAAVRRVMQEIAPDLPLLNPRTQVSQFEESFNQERLIANLATCFGLLAMVLIATGIYGTLAYRVSRRTSEIGVRIALGAQRMEVLWMVLRESLLVLGAGVLVGLPLAVAAAQLLRTMLYGVAPGDPITFVVALVVIAAVAFAASLIPARRAAATDPIVALRYE